MTKKAFFGLSVFILLFSIPAFSQGLPQQVAVAYVNTTELLKAFPEREAATGQLITLSENYKKELELMQNEYNKSIQIILLTSLPLQRTLNYDGCKS